MFLYEAAEVLDVHDEFNHCEWDQLLLILDRKSDWLYCSRHRIFTANEQVKDQGQYLGFLVW